MNSNNSNRRRAASARGFLALFAITPLAALGILAGAVPAARAADTTCPPSPILGTTINGNLTVLPGAFCLLATVTVTGNVQVGKGASLLVLTGPPSETVIGGNVQADKCNSVAISGGGAISVGGNVQFRNCTGRSGYDGGLGTLTIGGNFACDHNSGGCLAVFGSVRGNVQVDNNSGSVVVGGNTIGGNLHCAGNSGGVSTGRFPPNIVTGNKQGQCAGLLGRCSGRIARTLRGTGVALGENGARPSQRDPVPLDRITRKSPPAEIAAVKPPSQSIPSIAA